MGEEPIDQPEIIEEPTAPVAESEEPTAPETRVPEEETAEEAPTKTEATEDFVTVAKLTELEDNKCTTVDVNGTAVALYKVNGEVFATSNTCAHKGGPLGEGTIEGEDVVCPWHGWRFNVKTGVSPVSAEATIPSYKVKVDGEDVKVSLN